MNASSARPAAISATLPGSGIALGDPPLLPVPPDDPPELLGGLDEEGE